MTVVPLCVLLYVTVLVVAFVAAALGVISARASYDFLFAYLRRSPRWRRFNRALARLFR